MQPRIFEGRVGFCKLRYKFLAIIWHKITWKYTNNSSKYTYTTMQFNDKENHQKYKRFCYKKKMLFSVAILYQGWANLFLGVRLFGRATLLARSSEHAKRGCSKSKCTSSRDTTRNIDFCFLSPKQACSFHFKCVPSKIFALMLL